MMLRRTARPQLRLGRPPQQAEEVSLHDISRMYGIIPRDDYKASQPPKVNPWGMPVSGSPAAIQAVNASNAPSIHTQGKAHPGGASQGARSVTPSANRPAMATQSVMTFPESQQSEAMHDTLVERHMCVDCASYNITMNNIGFAIPRNAYPSWQRAAHVKNFQVQKGAHTTWPKHAQAGTTIIVLRLCMFEPTVPAAFTGNAVQSWAHKRNDEYRYIQISYSADSMEVTGPRDLLYHYFGALLAGESPSAKSSVAHGRPIEPGTWREAVSKIDGITRVRTHVIHFPSDWTLLHSGVYDKRE